MSSENCWSCVHMIYDHNSQLIDNIKWHYLILHTKPLSVYLTFHQKPDTTTGEQTIPVLVSSDADITVLSIRYCGYALLVLVLLGSLYDVTRYIRGLLHRLYFIHTLPLLFAFYLYFNYKVDDCLVDSIANFLL